MAKNQYQLVTFFLNGKKLELRRLTDLTDPIDKAIASGTTR